MSEERKIAEAAITTSTRLKTSLASEKEARSTCEKVLKEKEVYKSFHLCLQCDSLTPSDVDIALLNQVSIFHMSKPIMGFL